VPLQVTVPPVGVSQGVQRVPQVATSLFETQAVPHSCVPWLHV
jgi:hypothetical protein